MTSAIEGVAPAEDPPSLTVQEMPPNPGRQRLGFAFNKQ